MTAVRGGRAGPNGSGGSYPNEVQTDRAILFQSVGARFGVAKGLIPAVVAGALRIDFTAGFALVPEVLSASLNADRGYAVWADTTTQVPIATPSAGVRRDQIVAAFVDVEAGTIGTGFAAAGGVVGAHLVSIPGVSGSSVAPSTSDIIAYLGRGGFLRLATVDVDPGVTTIAANKLIPEVNYLNRWQSFLSAITAANGFTFATARAMLEGTHIDMFLTGAKTTGSTYTGSATAGTNGAISGTPAVCTGVPAGLLPASGDTIYGSVNAPGKAGTVSLDSTGSINLQTLYPSSSFAAGQSNLVYEFSYSVELG